MTLGMKVSGGIRNRSQGPRFNPEKKQFYNSSLVEFLLGKDGSPAGYWILDIIYSDPSLLNGPDRRPQLLRGGRQSLGK
jgi:hypothetical protein